MTKNCVKGFVHTKEEFSKYIDRMVEEAYKHGIRIQVVGARFMDGTCLYINHENSSLDDLASHGKDLAASCLRFLGEPLPDIDEEWDIDD